MNNEKRAIWLIGIFFQVILILIAQIIAYYTQGINLIKTIGNGDLLSINLLINLATGAAIAVIIYVVVLLGYLKIPYLRNWSQNIVFPMIRQFEPRMLLAMAVLAGVSEELLFRGALQPIIGIWLAGLLFGFVHYWGKRELLLYGVIASVMGFIMGIAYNLTGEILVPIFAHSLYNFLIIISYYRGVFE